jgi:hypothetical protein
LRTIHGADCGNFKPGSGAEYLEGETHDRERLDLPPAQEQLLREILALGKTTVVFLLNGGSVRVDLMKATAHTSRTAAIRGTRTGGGSSQALALVEAFYPGAEGGTALAQALFGVENKWGKMPYTTYVAGWETRHNFLDHEVSTTGRTYRYAPDEEVLVPFGFGLSLTTFELQLQMGSVAEKEEEEEEEEETVESELAVNVSGRNSSTTSTTPPHITLRTDGTSGNATVRVRVSNTGTRGGDEVVQAYVVPVKVGGFSILPRRSLFDFTRVAGLGAGQTATATFVFNVAELLLVDDHGDRVAAPGTYAVRFETGGMAEGVEVAVELVGPVVVVDAFPVPVGRGVSGTSSSACPRHVHVDPQATALSPTLFASVHAAAAFITACSTPPITTSTTTSTATSTATSTNNAITEVTLASGIHYLHGEPLTPPPHTIWKGLNGSIVSGGVEVTNWTEVRAGYWSAPLPATAPTAPKTIRMGMDRLAQVQAPNDNVPVNKNRFCFLDHVSTINKTHTVVGIKKGNAPHGYAAWGNTGTVVYFFPRESWVSVRAEVTPIAELNGYARFMLYTRDGASGLYGESLE